MKGWGGLAQWWTNGRAGNRATARYRITCACGHACEGQRQASSQVVRCSSCQREHFVLPFSPLPAVVAPGCEPGRSSMFLRRCAGRPWFWPVVAGGLTLVIAAGALWLLVAYLLPAGRTPGPAASPVRIDDRLARGKEALASANFAKAVEELDAAQAMVAGQPQLLSLAERRQLAQLRRQAGVLLDWPRESLEQILSRASRLNDEEWQAVVGRYQGKGVVFDVQIRRDASRQYHVTSTRAGPVRLRLEVQGLKLLDHLPLEARQRVIFAARLVEVRRDGEGNCVVRLDPQSGVLLTDVPPALLGPVLTEPNVQPILALQREWAAELP
jgi:hypothetical protein